MKKILLASLLVIGFTTGANAQQKVIPGQCPQVTMAGDFNNGTDTAQKAWVLATISGVSGTTATATFPVFYTVRDTVRNAATTNDSAHCRLAGEYNSVTLEVHASIDSGGTGCDSVIVQFWGTATYGNGQGSYRLLQSTTLGTTNSTDQVITYLPASGVGHPWTNYRTTVDVADLLNTCRVSWRGYVMVR